MKRRTVLKGLLGAIPVSFTSYSQAAALFSQLSVTEDVVHFEPTWASLQQYHVPDWFRDAKFGIRAHWGGQCLPGTGKNYARDIYVQGSEASKIHRKKYGNPSDFGYNEILNQWKAEKWRPDDLLTLYKSAGARYFIALANDDDNFDLFNSKHHPWNSMRFGPKKDIIAQWSKATRSQGLYFGASVHASQAAQVQQHTQGSDKGSFLNRAIDLIDQHEPDLLYFEDISMPSWPVNDTGLHIAAHLYNKSIFRKGKVQAIINSRNLDELQRRCLVWNPSASEITGIQPMPWQEDICLGNLYYDKSIYEKHAYRSAATVITRLADVVSKNGNLLLNVPVRGDGTIDTDEKMILENIGTWMATYGECIYGTRPWKVSGEGPSMRTGSLLPNKENNETTSKQDIRYTSRGRHIYAIASVDPVDQQLLLRSAGTAAAHITGEIERVVLVGNNTNLVFSRSTDGLRITLPPSLQKELPFAIKITTSRVSANIT